jgi:hypothetical protein
VVGIEQSSAKTPRIAIHDVTLRDIIDTAKSTELCPGIKGRSTGLHEPRPVTGII